MSFVTISDVHIKNSKDDPSELFLMFLDHEKTRSADEIFLLGDIFDLLVGDYIEYEERNPEIFMKIKDLLDKGKRIFQFEGNHDFHFEGLINKLIKKWNVPSDSWTYHKKPVVLERYNKRILFAHGDEIELGNPSYKIYRSLIRSFPIRALAMGMVPFSFVKWIGDSASKKSRERNLKAYDNQSGLEEIKGRFRKSFQYAAKKYKADMVICGHSHCRENFITEGKTYLNNGYFPTTKLFYYFDEKGPKEVSL